MIITNIIKVESGIACAMVPSVDSEVFIDGSGCSTRQGYQYIDNAPRHNSKISPNNHKNSSINNNKIRLNRINEQNIGGVTDRGAHTSIYVGPRAQSREELLALY